MKNYNKPEIEITNLNNVDVVLVSGINTTGANSNFTLITSGTATYNSVEF